MAARDDVQDALLVRHPRHRQGERRVDVADEEVHLVALDELARLLHGGAGLSARRVLDEQLHLAAEDPTFGVDLLDGELGTDELVLPQGRVGSRERVVEADLDRLLAARLDDGRGEERGARGRRGLDDGPPRHRGRSARLLHRVLSLAVAASVSWNWRA